MDQIKDELNKWLVSGEDTIAYSDQSNYAANLEMATSLYKPSQAVTIQEDLAKVETPDCKTIDEVSAFLQVDESQMIKTLLFMADSQPVVALLVGNDQVNDVKLKNYLGADFLEPADEEQAQAIFGAHFGSLGPVGLSEEVTIIADRKIQDLANAIAGANEDSYHLTSVNPGRDFTPKDYVDILDESGRSVPIIMGCYGIGVSRILSAVIEQHARLFVNKTPKGAYHLAWGINFPKELAPFDVHLITVNTKDYEAQELTAKLGNQLTAAGYQVLTDDRNERVGSKFSDSDWLTNSCYCW